jgi:hypothetical protein
VFWKINLTLVSLSTMSGKRSSGYVKDNDVRYGLKVAHHDLKSSKVIGLQCRFCIAFGREEKVGSKRKAATTIQGWSHPFCYDNIENHLRNQHLVNGLYTRLLNPLLSTLHSSMTFRLRSRTPSKHISSLRLWALIYKLFMISRRTLWILLWAT